MLPTPVLFVLLDKRGMIGLCWVADNATTRKTSLPLARHCAPPVLASSRDTGNRTSSRPQRRLVIRRSETDSKLSLHQPLLLHRHTRILCAPVFCLAIRG